MRSMRRKVEEGLRGSSEDTVVLVSTKLETEETVSMWDRPTWWGMRGSLRGLLVHHPPRLGRRSLRCRWQINFPAVRGGKKLRTRMQPLVAQMGAGLCIFSGNTHTLKVRFETSDTRRPPSLREFSSQFYYVKFRYRCATFQSDAFNPISQMPWVAALNRRRFDVWAQSGMYGYGSSIPGPSQATPNTGLWTFTGALL